MNPVKVKSRLEENTSTITPTSQRLRTIFDQFSKPNHQNHTAEGKKRLGESDSTAESTLVVNERTVVTGRTISCHAIGAVGETPS
ncbi:hypothetical protein K0M31_017835 [Melipona bicolor]|uniref:Uncharacterized protein n=1 Tax=Melipona bicolor TaxID=60889 RepID=A0AA40KSU6_9HYME|nr:hypothetical protein K0M31_017835 [Melipona bicolor]